MKLTVSPHVAKLLDAYAIAHNVTPEEAGERLVLSLEIVHRYHGNMQFLGADWQAASKIMLEETGSSSNRGTIVDDEPKLTNEQRKLLEPSDTLTSGYAGVYSNGAKGWRAEIREGGHRQRLPTRRTAEAAAWDYYQAKQEAQGKASEEQDATTASFAATLAWARKEHPELSEADVRRLAEDLEAAIRPR